ncbi:MAG: glycosyltransferase [Chitinophagaceae bacterium]
MEIHLHIICLNVPYPVNYGGVFDLFYKLAALQHQGVLIHLHCFDYGRGQQTELNKYCTSVNYYQRNQGYKGLSAKLPYIVSSRKNEQLFENLLKDAYPILMEGIHCTYPLTDIRFANRKMYVRLHNVEYKYYYDLYKCAALSFKKLYYLYETKLLKKYEFIVANKATFLWAVSKKDVEVYSKEFRCTNIDYLPLFLPDWKVECKEGMGIYCLFHGDLEIEGNEKIAIWLLKNVFAKTKLPFIISGKNPSKYLQKICHQLNSKLIANPSEAEMQELITEAHINILPSFNETGIKLKLLNALFNGRHCVVNNAMIKSTDLANLCHISNSALGMQQLIEQLFHQPFTKKEIEFRKNILLSQFNNEENAKYLVKSIWKNDL